MRLVSLVVVGVWYVSLLLGVSNAARLDTGRFNDDGITGLEAEINPGQPIVSEDLELVNGVGNNVTNSSAEDGAVEGTPEFCLHGTYQSSPTNCSTFIVCNDGNQTEGYCPPGFWFDPYYKGDMLCNHPEVVCAANNNVCDCAALYPPLQPDPLIEPDVNCLEDNRFHFSSSKVDCGRYFVCFNGNVQRMECKSGFQFDPKSEVCDYPELVNCQVKSKMSFNFTR